VSESHADVPAVIVVGAQAAGLALFELNAEKLIHLTDDTRETAIERVQQVPYIGKVKVEWRPARKEFFIVLAEANRLPNDFVAQRAAETVPA
jgi:hypothetical protein